MHPSKMGCTKGSLQQYVHRSAIAESGINKEIIYEGQNPINFTYMFPLPCCGRSIKADLPRCGRVSIKLAIKQSKVIFIHLF